METIAKAAGVSIMTVSRALRGNPRHAKSTRERIVKIAKELGYRPNPFVAALNSARSRKGKAGATANLAAIFPGTGAPTDPSKPRPIRDDLHLGAYERSAELGFALDFFYYDAKVMPWDRLRRVFINRGIRGLIIMPAPYAPFHLDFDFEGFAVAAIGYSVDNHVSRVVSDHYARTVDAFVHLEEKGYRNVGLIDDLDLNRRFQYQMAAAAGVAKYVAPRLRVHQLHTDISPRTRPFDMAFRKKVREWLLKKRIEAVVTQVEDVYETLLEDGVRIPEDVSYLHLQEHRDLRVACMDQRCLDIGRKAADLVIAMIHRNEFSVPERPSTVLTSSTWRDGATVPILGRD